MREFKNVGILLKEKRVVAGYTQKEVGDHVSLHSQYVSNWERGLCLPPRDVLKSVVKLLKVKQDEFFEAVMKDQTIEVRNFTAETFESRRKAKSS